MGLLRYKKLSKHMNIVILDNAVGVCVCVCAKCSLAQKGFISSRDGPIKSTEQGRDEKTQEHHLVRNDGGLLSGLQHNALAYLVHFVVCKVN